MDLRWDENLGLTTVEDYSKTVSSDGDAVTSPEKIAKACPNGIRVVGDLTSDLVALRAYVGGGYEELASGESIKVVIDETLDLIIQPNLILFAPSNDLFDELIERSVGREAGGPEGFAIVGVDSARKTLFGAVVDNWDSSGHDRENKTGFIECHILLVG